MISNHLFLELKVRLELLWMVLPLPLLLVQVQGVEKEMLLLSMNSTELIGELLRSITMGCFVGLAKS